MLIQKKFIHVVVAAALLSAIVWGRSASNMNHQSNPVFTPGSWSQQQLLLQRAMAGPLPAIAADIAVLHVFNIYAQSLDSPQLSERVWWPALYHQLRTAQAMDPYFRDVYRLTEGLLAYEAKRMAQAVELLSMSEPYLNSSDPLLVASFIAHQELHNDPLAIDLAKRASSKTDVQAFTIGYTVSLLKKRNNCHTALQFLLDRLHHIPEHFQQGIRNRIHKLQQNKQCQGEFQNSQQKSR